MSLRSKACPRRFRCSRKSSRNDDFTAEHGHPFAVSTKWLERTYLNRGDRLPPPPASRPPGRRPGCRCPGRARQVQVGDVRHRDEQPPRQAHRATRHRGEHHRLGPRPWCQATHPAVARCGTAQRGLQCRRGQRRRQIRRHRLPDAGRGHAHQRVRRPAGGQGRPSGGARIHEDGELRVRAGRRRSEEDFRWPGRRRGGRRHAGHAGRERRQGQGCCGCADISPSGGCVDSSLVRRSR